MKRRAQRCAQKKQEADLKINDEEHLICHNSLYIYSNINIIDIPNDILGIIITFTDIIGKHVLRFVNKYFHNIVHSVVVSKKLLPKEFHEWEYDYIAGQFGNILLFDWIIFIFGKSEISATYGLNIAARNGNLNLMKHMKKHYNFRWSEMTCFEAAEAGHLEVLKWLFEDGCPLKKKICETAAIRGHLDILKWARENGCHWDEETCSGAAKGGHLDILKWARENGCHWDSNTTYAAAMSGRLEILKWAIENGCEYYYNVIYAASKGSHLEILEWCRENGYHLDGSEFEIAVNEGHL
jgi:hypothetical protein